MLTPTQSAALKTDFEANTAVIPPGQPWTGAFAGTQVKDLPNTGDGNAAAAGWYNSAAAPAFVVWRDVPMETILNAVVFANMTPADAVPTGADLAVQVWIARAIACQGKQLNLQALTTGRSSAPMKRANYRAALQDCLTALPAGVAGANVSAGAAAVAAAAKFPATNAEKLFATGAGTTPSPADLGYEGPVTAADVETARNLP